MYSRVSSEWARRAEKMLKGAAARGWGAVGVGGTIGVSTTAGVNGCAGLAVCRRRRLKGEEGTGGWSCGSGSGEELPCRRLWALAWMVVEGTTGWYSP